MQFYDEHIYDAPLARIEGMYFDTQFVPRKYRELGLQDVKVVSQQPAPNHEVTCTLKMEPSIKVPGALKKVLGDGLIDVEWTDRWDTQTNKGELIIKLKQFASVSMHCDMSLEAHPQGTVNKMHWRVECSVPVVGGMLAKYLGEDIRKKSADDLAASKRILQDY